MLQAMNTGHEGSLSTVHSNSPRDALSRLETMVLMAGYELPLRAIRQQVSSALDVIVQLDRLDDGTRHVTAITEVQRMEGETITLQNLFEFHVDRVEADRTVVGRLEPTGLRPTFLSKFERHGIELPPDLFGTPHDGHVRRRRERRQRGVAQRGEPGMRALTATLAALVAVLALAGAGSAATGSLELTPVGRLPFPERGYVVDLQGRASVDPTSVRVTENGRRVTGVDVAPVAAAGIHFGVVLAIDASESMTGAPLAGALDAARAFVDAARGRAGGRDRRLQRRRPGRPGADERRRGPAPRARRRAGARLRHADLRRRRRLARAARAGAARRAARSCSSPTAPTSAAARASTRRSRRRARGTCGSSRSGSARARSTRPRSGSSREETGGTFAEASSPERLSAIYDALGRRLASEYVVRYRSDAAPRSEVDVSIGVRRPRRRHDDATSRRRRPGCGPTTARSWSRFVASPAAPFVLALLIAGLAALAVIGFARPRRSTLVERVDDFAGGHVRPARTPIAETRAEARPPPGHHPPPHARAAAGDRTDRHVREPPGAPDGRRHDRGRARPLRDLADLRPHRPAHPAHHARVGREEAQGRPRPVRRPAGAEPPGARLGAPHRPQLHRRAHGGRRQRPRAVAERAPARDRATSSSAFPSTRR